MLVESPSRTLAHRCVGSFALMADRPQKDCERRTGRSLQLLGAAAKPVRCRSRGREWSSGVYLYAVSVIQGFSRAKWFHVSGRRAAPPVALAD